MKLSKLIKLASRVRDGELRVSAGGHAWRGASCEVLSSGRDDVPALVFSCAEEGLPAAALLEAVGRFPDSLRDVPVLVRGAPSFGHDGLFHAVARRRGSRGEVVLLEEGAPFSPMPDSLSGTQHDPADE